MGYFFFPTIKVVAGYPIYPVTGRDTAKSGIGFLDNHHLNNLIESTFVNVGGFYQNVKVSSPPRIDRSVGGAIVCAGQRPGQEG